MTETKTSVGHMVASGLVEPITQCECCFGPRETPPFLYAMGGLVAICARCFENEKPAEFVARRRANMQTTGGTNGKP